MKRPPEPTWRQAWSVRASAWWRERFDLAPVLAVAARKSVPIHRLSWIYLLGGAALFLLAAQVTTGCLLMLYYQPTEQGAHESLRKIMTEVPYGWLVRSVHVWGAHAFIGTVILHFLTVLFAKAYRRPRELTWLSGVVLLFLAAGMGFSGYLLPWNQLSYYATLVGTQIPGSFPIVGDTAVRLLRGSAQISGDTITRFHAAHVVILPLALGVVLLVHLSLVQLHGMSLPLGKSPARVKDQQPFFSEFLLTDACVWLLVFGALVTLAVYVPAEMGAKADPLQSAPEGIKPEWYFLFLFQLLKYMPKSVGILLLAAGAVFPFAIPFLDRRAERGDRSPGFTAVYLALLAAAILLEIRAILSPSVAKEPGAFTAETYRPIVDTVWLAFLWAAIGFVVYYLQQLRRQNRQIRLLSPASQEK